MPELSTVNRMIKRIDYHQRYIEKRKWSGTQSKLKCFVCGNVCHFYWSPAGGVEWIRCVTPGCVNETMLPPPPPVVRAKREIVPTLTVNKMVNDIKQYKPRKLF